MSGTLFLVATPIGNLKDISQRALETLSGVDLIACEDTRHSKKLFNAYAISKKLISYHAHNESARAAELIERLTNGESVALVSDAGTPAISDPGYHLVRSALENGIQVVPIPGPVAFVNALIVSGLPTKQVFFGGFLPSKKGERRKYLASIKAIPATLVFYESPHRLVSALSDCTDVLGDRPAAAVREITKVHEEVVTGSLSQLAAKFSAAIPKGEFVLVIDGTDGKAATAIVHTELSDLVERFESSGDDRRTALKKAAKELGISRSEAYREFHR